MSRSELYNRFRHTRNIQHMVIVCQCCEPLFVFNGLWRWSLWFRALSCHVQNFTVVSDIHEIYSTWSSFVSVVNHCLFSTVCGGGVCGFALFRHGGGWIHGEWRLGKFVTTLWYDCIFEIDWQVGSQRCCHAGALAELACVWILENLLTSHSAFAFNRLSAERSVGIRDASNSLEVYWHVWCLLFILLICLTGSILTWFGMFGAENAFVIPTICDLSMCCCCNYSFWLCFRGYAAMFDAWLFTFVWQAVSWHDLACLVHRMLLMVHCKHVWFEHLMLTLLQEVYCHVWCLFIDICLPGGVLTWFGMFRLRLWHDLAWFVPGAILKGGQDTTRARKSPENKCEGFLHGSLSRVGKITLPIHPDNPHLTTFTQHVMVGITRSKVIFFCGSI